MAEYRKTSHSVYDIKYHVVWITKYRKPVLSREIGKRVRDLTRVICTSLDVEIAKGHVAREHVHLLISVPSYIAVSKLVQRIKGVTSRKLLQENKGLNKAFWGRHLWSRGYFGASTGNVSEEVIASYIEQQGKEPRDEDAEFEIEP